MTLDPADAPKVANRSATREIRILVESPALDMTWSRFGPHEPGASSAASCSRCRPRPASEALRSPAAAS